MAGPGGKQLGRVSVKVVPDTDGFRSELRRKLEGMSNAEVKVDIVPDLNGLQEKVRAAAQAAEKNKIKLDVDVERFHQGVNNAIRSIDDEEVKIKTNIDRDDIDRQIDNIFRRFDQTKIQVKTDFEGGDDFIARVRRSFEQSDMFGPVLARQVREALDKSDWGPTVRKMRNEVESMGDVWDNIARIEEKSLASVRGNTDEIERSTKRVERAWQAVQNRIRGIGDALKLNIAQASRLATSFNEREVNIKFDADELALMSKIEAIKREIASLHDKVEIDFDLKETTLQAKIERVREQLNQLSQMEATPRVEADIAQALAQLRAFVAELDQVGRKRVDAHVGVDVDGQAKLAALFAELELLSAKRFKTTIEVDTDKGVSSIRRFSGEATSRIGTIGKAITGFLGFIPILGRVFSTASDSFGRLTTAADAFGAGTKGILPVIGNLAAAVIQLVAGFAILMVVLGGISLLILAIGAALTAVFGIIAGLVGALNGALAAIALPFAAIALGIDGVNKAMDRLNPAVDRLRTRMNNVFSKETVQITNMLSAAIDKIAPQFESLGRSIVVAAEGLTRFLTSAPVMESLRRTIENVGAAVAGITPAIGQMIDAILIVTSQSNAFTPLIAAVNAFGTAWRDSVINMVNDGSLNAAFSGLAEILSSVAEGLVSMVENGLRALASMAPGVTAFVDSLTNFFNRLDWTSLGDSVGRVFDGIARAIDNVSPETIQAIADAFASVGDAFQSEEFTTGITGLIDLVPQAITVMGDLAREFSSVAGPIMAAAIGIAKAIAVVLDAFGYFQQGVGIFLLSLGAVFDNDNLKNLGTEMLLEGSKNLRDEITKIETEAREGGKKIPKALEEGVKSGLPINFDSFFTTGLKPPTQIFTSLETNFKENGTKLIDSFKKSITEGTPEAKNEVIKAFADLGSGVLTEMPNILGHIASVFGDGNPAVEGAKEMAERLGASKEQIAEAIKGVQDSVTQLGSIGAAVDAALNGIKTKFGDAFKSIVLDMATQLNTANLSIMNSLTLMQTSVQTGVTNIGTAFVNAGTSWNSTMTANMLMLQTSITTGIETIKSAFVIAFEGIGMSIDAGFVGIQAAFTTGLTAIETAVTTSFTTITTNITTAMTTIANAVILGMTAVAQAFADGLTAGAANITAALQQISQSIDFALIAMRDGAFQKGQEIGQAIADGLTQAASAVGDAMRTMTEAVTSGVNDMVNALNTGISAMLDALSSAVGAFREYGANMGNALAEGLESAVPRVEAAANKIIAAAKAAVEAAAQIHSPSRVFIKLGGYIGAGFVIGIEKYHRKVRIVAFRLVKIVKTAAENIGEVFNGSLGDQMMGDTLSDVMATQRAMKGTHAIETSYWEKYVIAEGYGRGYVRDLIDALHGCEFKFDRDGVARIVNNSNIRKKRRR